MHLSITSQIDTNVGIPASGVIGNINAHTNSIMATGQVPCDIEFYISIEAKDNGMSRIFPVILNTDGTIEELISSCTINLTEGEITGANLPNTIYTKVAAKLSADYGWTVAVA